MNTLWLDPVSCVTTLLLVVNPAPSEPSLESSWSTVHFTVIIIPLRHMFTMRYESSTALFDRLFQNKIQKETRGRAAVWIIHQLQSVHTQILFNRMYTDSWLGNLTAYNEIKLSLNQYRRGILDTECAFKTYCWKRWSVDPKAQHSAPLRDGADHMIVLWLSSEAMGMWRVFFCCFFINKRESLIALIVLHVRLMRRSAISLSFSARTGLGQWSGGQTSTPYEKNGKIR